MDSLPQWSTRPPQVCVFREDYALPLTAVRRRSSSHDGSSGGINVGVTILCFTYFMTVFDQLLLRPPVE